MIDFHCHLDLYPDAREVLAQAIDHGCYVLAVTTTPLAWEGNRKLVGESARVQIAPGLHPELVATRHREVDRLCALVSEARYVGEVGLDGTKPHRRSMQLQRRVFDAVLTACEAAGGRILSIHSRGAASLVLDHLEAHQEAGTPVLHWFSGSGSELKRAVDMGCWFSVGPAMLRSRKGLDLASLIPRSRVLTETDGPFTQFRSAPLKPWDVVEAESLLARVWGIEVSDARRQLLANFDRLVARR